MDTSCWAQVQWLSESDKYPTWGRVMSGTLTRLPVQTVRKFGSESATRLREAGIASNRISAMIRRNKVAVPEERTAFLIECWYNKQNKGVWGMPWLSEAMKGVISCEKLRGRAHTD
ncbi:unnamed protein product [Bathycoccus prasinos]